MPDEKALLERQMERVRVRRLTVEEFHRRRLRRRRREQTIAGVVGIAVFLAVILLVAIQSVDRTHRPAVPTPTPSDPIPSGRVLRRDGEVLRSENEGPGALVALDPQTGESRVIVEAPDVPGRIGHARWSADGRWAAYDMAVESELWVVDAEGEPRRVAVNPGPWAWSPVDAQLAMVRDSTLTILDPATGRETEIGRPPRDVTSAPEWSPDGTRLLFGARGGALYSVDVRSAELSVFVRLPGEYLDSVDGIAWSPDGSQVVVLNDHAVGGGRLFVVNADGSDVRVLVEDFVPRGFDWSPDGTRLVYADFAGPLERELRIWLTSLDGSPPTQIVSYTSRDCCIDGGGPVWSPDGSQIAFTTDRRSVVIDSDGGVLRPIQRLVYESWSGGSYFCGCYG